MNHWKETWNKRDKEIQITDNIFDMFCRLKKADGYDTLIEDGYYEGLFEEWKRTNEDLSRNGVSFASVYEVGCGSGVNLYLYKNLFNIKKLGGIDYSKPLIEIAEQVLKDAELEYGEAVEIDVCSKYDLVLSEGVFIYFQDVQYGMQVFEKMYEETKGTILIISHQERILNIADQIVLLADGCVKKVGTREDLMPELLGVGQPCKTLTDKM